MRKIIFLDIDGVIATPETLIDGMWGLTPSKQTLLGEILEATDAELVISSSWRHHTVELTKEYFEKKGFQFVEKIIGVTIRAYHYISKEEKIHLSIPRGVEIKQWLDTHIHSDNGKNWERKTLNKDYSYVILDDESDMLLEHRENFINTDGVEGLSKIDTKLAIKILNNEM